MQRVKGLEHFLNLGGDEMMVNWWPISICRRWPLDDGGVRQSLRPVMGWSLSEGLAVWEETMVTVVASRETKTK